jgi:DNA adenine methylase
MGSQKIYFFTRIGGKSKIADKIIEYFPRHYDTYIEPFAGSAQVFLSLKTSEKTRYILNDLDTDIYHLWKDMKRACKDKLKEFPWKGDKELFHILKNYRTNDPTLRLWKNLYIHFYSYSGDKTSGFCSKKSIRGKGFLKTFHLLKKKLEHVQVYNKDYKTIIQRFDGSASFFYFDPPYVGKSRLYDNMGIDPFELKQTIDTIKGKFILSYNDDALIRNIFKEYRIIKVDIPYTSVKRKHIQTELLIMNF